MMASSSARGARVSRVVAPVAAARLLVGAALLALWWAASAFGWLSASALPAPIDVAAAVLALAATGGFWAALGQTLSSAALGLLLGIIVGAPLGLVLGFAPPVERSTRVVMDIGRSFPIVALLPVLILTFGTTKQLEVIVVFLGVLWPILLQTIYGVRRIDPVVRDTVRSFQIPQRLRFAKVLLPSAAPFTATGIRIAAAGAILLSLAVEILARTPGLGLELVKAQGDGRPELALAYLGWAGVIGIALNTVLASAEARVLGWSTRSDPEVV